MPIVLSQKQDHSSLYLNGWHREPVMDITEFEDVPLHQMECKYS